MARMQKLSECEDQVTRLHEALRRMTISFRDLLNDWPQREPAMFRTADLVLLTKTDLLEAARFDDLLLHRNLRSIGCDAPVLGLSSRRGMGIDVFCEWLRAKEAMQSLHVASRTPEPAPARNPLIRYN